MDENSIKKSVCAILAAESPWAFTSRMAWSPRFLFRAPIEFGRGFFTPPPLCPELCTCFHILKMQSTPLGLTTLSEALQGYPSPGLCALWTISLMPASSVGLVLYWRTCMRLQWYFLLLTPRSVLPPTTTVVPLTQQKPPTLDGW